jgi:hypothetical protein
MECTMVRRHLGVRAIFDAGRQARHDRRLYVIALRRKASPRHDWASRRTPRERSCARAGTGNRELMRAREGNKCERVARGGETSEVEYIRLRGGEGKRPREGKERGRANLESSPAEHLLLPAAPSPSTSSICEFYLFFNGSSLIHASPSAGLQAHVTQV